MSFTSSDVYSTSDEFDLPDILPCWSSSLDRAFGVYSPLAPPIVDQALIYVIASWALLFGLTTILSTLYMNEMSTTISMRVAVCVGALYRYIDPTIMLLPRMVTCGFLHFNTQHIFMNATGIASSWGLFKRSFNKDPDAAFIDYYWFPIWLGGCIIGSALSFNTSLKSYGNYTLGGSGGVCALSGFVLATVVKVEGFRNEDQAQTLVTMMVMLAIQALPLGAPGSRGQKADFTSHAGGTIYGIACSMLLLFLHDRFSEASVKRLGYTLSLFFGFIVLAAFMEVFRQWCAGGQERIVRAYYRWMKLDNRIYERPLGAPRRWSIAIDRGIERRIVQNYHELDIPKNLKGKEDVDDLLNDLKPDRALMDYYKRRQTTY